MFVYLLMVVYDIIQMQQRQKIRKQLQRMQQECVKDYLQEKLQEITRKQVIQDILQEFLQNNNKEFMENISENIVQAKEQNRLLKKQMENLKINSQKQLNQTCLAIHKQYQSKHSQQLSQIVRLWEDKLGQLQQKYSVLEQINFNLKEQIVNHESSFKIKQNQANTEIEKLKQDLAQSKKSFNNFKDSCEKIINQCNREKDKEKLRLIEQWKKQRQSLQYQIHELSANKVKSYELQMCNKTIETQQSQINLLKQTLIQSQLKFEQLNMLYMESTNNYEFIKNQQNDLKCQLATTLRTLQSTELSLNYLKQQNNYLRQQILSFSQRYQQAQKQKLSYQKEIQQSKQMIKIIDAQYYSHRTKRQQQEEQYKQKYDSTITEMMIQVRQLREQIQKYSHKITQKDKIINQFTQENQSLINSAIILKEQLNLKIQNHQVNQLEIQHYQHQITNIQHSYKQQMEQLKRTLEAHWNLKNQQLIQQKYTSLKLQQQIMKLNSQNTTLNNQIDTLKQQIIVKQQKLQQKQKYYNMLNQQMSIFSKKLSLPTKPSYFNNNKSSIYFHLSQMQHQIKYLQQQNNQLRLTTYKSIEEISHYLQQTISYMMAKGYQHNHSTPKTQVNLKRHIQLKLITNCKEDNPNKNGHQKMHSQSNNFSQIKKTLKNIHQRYQTVQTQNKFYSTHIDSFIKKA